MRVELQGIPETTLWTLYMRAVEARRPDSVIDDPKAVELLERIDYPFEERFGVPRLSQWQALRARTFDDEVRRFLAGHPDGTVAHLLPQPERVRTLACSALDEAWMDQVDPSRGLLITAQGLLMYFQPDQVHGLIVRCRERFPGAELVFDGRLKTPSGYEPPPWLWGIDSKERRRMGARRLRPPHGRGIVGSVVLPQLLYVMAIDL
jgi:O-methyltransferase involved in polyketide biosynthesis